MKKNIMMLSMTLVFLGLTFAPLAEAGPIEMKPQKKVATLSLDAFKAKLKGSFKGIPLQNNQGKPCQSILEITGKIDLGTMDYYSVEPDINMSDEMAFIAFVPSFYDCIMTYFTGLIQNGQQAEVYSVAASIQECGFADFSVRPQLKQSESQGFSFYLFINTAAHPKFFECFKTMTQVQVPMGKLKVRKTRNGPVQEINAQNPPTGGTATCSVGPLIQPK